MTTPAVFRAHLTRWSAEWHLSIQAAVWDDDEMYWHPDPDAEPVLEMPLTVTDAAWPFEQTLQLLQEHGWKAAPSNEGNDWWQPEGREAVLFVVPIGESR
ncbi:hypothetical protein [Streptomyces virginiae]|uniref:hypothetical protein n=1 Tax=Streptomyces virginiae TaxID=1961 RepID=UPI003657E15B